MTAPVPLSDADLAAIEARTNAATGGPWRWAYPGSDTPELTGVAGDENYTYETQVLYAEHDGGCGCRRACTMELLIDNDADAEFIAHARSDVPALLAALVDARSLEHDLTATLTDAGLPPSEHGGVRGAVLLLVGLWRGERQRADEAEARIQRVEAAIAAWPDGSERASGYAAARGQCKRAIVAALATETQRPGGRNE